jgi:hypothetical protein
VGDYFDQCPTTYPKPKITLFAKQCSDNDIKKMFLNAKHFVKDATEQ